MDIKHIQYLVETRAGPLHLPGGGKSLSGPARPEPNPAGRGGKRGLSHFRATSKGVHPTPVGAIFCSTPIIFCGKWTP